MICLQRTPSGGQIKESLWFGRKCWRKSGVWRRMYKWEPFKHSIFRSRLGVCQDLLGFPLGTVSLSLPWMQEPPAQPPNAGMMSTQHHAQRKSSFYFVLIPWSTLGPPPTHQQDKHILIQLGLPSPWMPFLPASGAPATSCFSSSLPGPSVSAGCHALLLVRVGTSLGFVLSLLFACAHCLGQSVEHHN